MDQLRHDAICRKAAQYAEAFMKNDKFDASHDWTHIQRVRDTALSILAVERACPGSPSYDMDIIYLSALLHDITDHKYIDPSEMGNVGNKISTTLQDMGADESLAHAVQTVCNNVSYSHEKRNPSEVQETLRQFPELGIVQDADRLDAIGAVGIARVFAYTGASSARGNSRTLEQTIDHFHEKLERIQALMKTDEGRRRARERTLRLQQFRGWFAEETAAAV